MDNKEDLKTKILTPKMNVFEKNLNDLIINTSEQSSRLGAPFPFEKPRLERQTTGRLMEEDMGFSGVPLTRQQVYMPMSDQEKNDFTNDMIMRLQMEFNDSERTSFLRRLEGITMTPFIVGSEVGFIRDYDETKTKSDLYKSPFTENNKIVKVVSENLEDATVTICDDENNEHRVFRGVLTRFIKK